MFNRVAVSGLFCLLILGCAPGIVPTVDQISVPQVTALPANSVSRPLIFDRLVVDIPRASHLGESRRGHLCLHAEPLKWSFDSVTRREGQFHIEFERILTQNNFRVPPKPSSLFETPQLTGAELFVAARITKITENVCSTVDMWAPSHQYMKGNARLALRWEVYSIADGKVVVSLETEGSAIQDAFKPTAETSYVVEAFANALRGLLNNEAFRKVTTSIPVSGKE